MNDEIDEMSLQLFFCYEIPLVHINTGSYQYSKQLLNIKPTANIHSILLNLIAMTRKNDTISTLTHTSIKSKHIELIVILSNDDDSIKQTSWYNDYGNYIPITNNFTRTPSGPVMYAINTDRIKH